MTGALLYRWSTAAQLVSVLMIALLLSIVGIVYKVSGRVGIQA